jgi:hypothetical protein
MNIKVTHPTGTIKKNTKNQPTGEKYSDKNDVKLPKLLSEPIRPNGVISNISFIFRKTRTNGNMQ